MPRAIIEAARRRLREAPDEPLSIRELARLVGVSPNAPYRHFADRDALLRAIAADGYRRAADTLARESGPAAVAVVWDELVAEEPALASLMISLPPGSADDADLQEAIAEWLGELTRAVERSVRGEDPGEVVRRAVAGWAAVHGLASLRQSGALAVIDGFLLPESRHLARQVIRG